MDHQPLDRILQLPCWSGRVDPAPLLGGITNKNYLVADRGQKFVVRLGQDIPIHGVMRFNELAASRAAFEAGVSPEVVYAEPGALVLRYIEGRALSPELVRDPELLPGVMDLIKRCHEQVPRHLRGPSLVFWVFQVIRGYATELQACASSHVEALPQLIERAERLEREVGPVSIVFGHNDLLAANFIDDGKRLWLIDWDYAGFNSPLFDLGGLVSNSELGEDQARFVLERYFGKVDLGLQRRFAAMKCASLLRETMWSMVSEVYSKIQFDYGAYTSDYLARFTRAYDEFTEFDELSGERTMTTPPSAAQAVIIGGGIVGCSTAYHLARAGFKDIVLLERAKLTSGSTWHAAGLVGQLRTSANVTQLLKYSVELYDKLEQETGLATGWKRNGGLRLACNPERLVEIKRQATTAHSFGLEMHLLSPAEAKALWPIMDSSDVAGAAFLPTDGQANPSDIAQALAKGARMQGVKIVEDCPVIGIHLDCGRVSAVETSHGVIRTEIVVNCAGQWARQIGQLAGVNVPLVSVQHQYIVTEPIAGVPKNLPTLRDPDRLIYFKEEVGGLVMGGYEPNPIPWAEQGIPGGFEFQLLSEDWDHFEPVMMQALARVPALETAGIKQLINGPESFTPDGNFILGEAPEVRGFYVGAGFNAFGIASAGGAGRALAEWIAAGEPPMDLWPVDIRRFGRHHRSERWVRTRTLEAYAKHYTMAWPFEEYRSARPLRVSPLYQRLKDQGACFGEKLGWERPNWFAPAGVEPKDIYTYGRQNWFPYVATEHQACRERVALFDQTSFAKFLLIGEDAERALQWICANDVGKPPGSLTYTQMLNARGGIECDLTVARLSPTEYYIVTGTGFATHDFAWIRRNIPPDCADATLVDVTSAYCVLALMGPRARDILTQVTHADMSNAAFPFGAWREIEVAGALVRALRVTYVGELGWELHIPVESALVVYERLMQAGIQHGIANAGYRAIESLRLEKGYRAWGSDIGPDHTPLEAGLAWAIKLAKGLFLGRDALLVQQSELLKKRLACFTVDDPSVVLLGRETIYRDGQRVGWLSSAGWGYTVGKNIGFGYVRNAAGVDDTMLTSGNYELEVAGERIACQLYLGALYDPRAARVKA